MNITIKNKIMKVLGMCGPSNHQGPLGNPEPASRDSPPALAPSAADEDASPSSRTAGLVASNSKHARPRSPSFYTQYIYHGICIK